MRLRAARSCKASWYQRDRAWFWTRYVGLLAADRSSQRIQLLAWVLHLTAEQVERFGTRVARDLRQQLGGANQVLHRRGLGRHNSIWSTSALARLVLWQSLL